MELALCLGVCAGEFYRFDFDPWPVKGPLLRLAVEHGWSYGPVIFRWQLGTKRQMGA